MGKRGPRPLEYSGQRFGLLTVLRRHGRYKLLCRCDCGVERYVYVANAITHPPKTHQACVPELQYELGL